MTGTRTHCFLLCCCVPVPVPVQCSVNKPLENMLFGHKPLYEKCRTTFVSTPDRKCEIVAAKPVAFLWTSILLQYCVSSVKHGVPLMVCFYCPTPMLIHIPIPIPILCRKALLGPIPMVILIQSYYENYLKTPYWYHIGVKLGTVPICIGIGIRIGSVETVLHIIILAIWIGIGIGVRQWKHTITTSKQM